MGKRTQAVWVAIAMVIFAAAGIGGGMYLQRTSFDTAERVDVEAEPPVASVTDGAPRGAVDTLTQDQEAKGPEIAETADEAAEPSRPFDAEAPRFDVVRVDPDGSALVAGFAMAGDEITLRLDGTEVATAKADAEGNFVSFFDLEAGEKPGLLTLESAAADGSILRASDSIIVAPPAPKIAAIEEPSLPDEAAATEIAVAPEIDIEVAEPEAPAIAAAVPGTPPVADTEPAAQPEIVVDAPAPAASDTVPTATAPVEVAEADAPTTGAELDVAAAEPAAPRLFRAGPEGVTVLNDPGQPPSVVETLGIDAIAYDDAGEVQLTGRAASESELRIYLDNRAIRTVRVGEGGNWASPLPDVETGVYTLRIDALSDDGTVASRIETPFERTAPELAAAARESGLTAITVQPGFTLWAISQGYFGDGLSYVQIFEANRDLIRDPNLIYPGQVFTLPEAAAEAETALAEEGSRP